MKSVARCTVPRAGWRRNPNERVYKLLSMNLQAACRGGYKKKEEGRMPPHVRRGARWMLQHMVLQHHAAYLLIGGVAP